MTTIETTPVDILTSSDRIRHLVCCTAFDYPRPYTSLCGLQLYAPTTSREMCEVCKDLAVELWVTWSCPDGHECPHAPKREP